MGDKGTKLKFDSLFLKRFGDQEIETLCNV